MSSKELEGTLSEISIALGDLVSILEAKADKKIDVHVPQAQAPQVAVNAQAGETVVHVIDRPAAKGWLVEFIFSGPSATVPTGAKLTRME